MEERGAKEMEKFVEERISGEANLWDKMTKCKVLSFNSSAKTITLPAKSDVLKLQATSGLMSRLLIVARSSREIDLEDVIGKYEFCTNNRILMKTDGTLHPTTNKSQIITVLESMAAQPTVERDTSSSMTCLVIDGMAVVHEVASVKSLATCKDLADAYVDLVESKGRNYSVVRVVFDNYSINGSLKEGTRERRKGRKVVRYFKAEDTTKLRDIKSFLASTPTKDSLTLYLSQKLTELAKIQVIVATRRSVSLNRSGELNPGVSSQEEEADTLMVLHGVEAAKMGFRVHIYSQDTDVLLLALRRTVHLGEKAAVLMGTHEHRRLILLQPIYDCIGANRAKALCKWHALTGCDTTGYIKGKSQKGCLDAFLKASPDIVSSISGLGVGNEPSAHTVDGCISYLCGLFCKKGIDITQPSSLRWMLFKQLGTEKGINNLLPTPGAWMEHVRRAHCQSSLWEQDLCLDPAVPDPVDLGWSKEAVISLLSCQACTCCCCGVS